MEFLAGGLDDDLDSRFQIVIFIGKNQLGLAALKSRGNIDWNFSLISSKLSLNRSRQMRFNLIIVR